MTEQIRSLNVDYYHDGLTTLPGIVRKGAENEPCDLVVFGLPVTDEKTGKTTLKTAALVDNVRHESNPGTTLFPYWKRPLV